MWLGGTNHMVILASSVSSAFWNSSSYWLTGFFVFCLLSHSSSFGGLSSSCQLVSDKTLSMDPKDLIFIFKQISVLLNYLNFLLQYSPRKSSKSEIGSAELSHSARHSSIFRALSLEWGFVCHFGNISPLIAYIITMCFCSPLTSSRNNYDANHSIRNMVDSFLLKRPKKSFGPNKCWSKKNLGWKMLVWEIFFVKIFLTQNSLSKNHLDRLIFGPTIFWIDNNFG